MTSEPSNEQHERTRDLSASEPPKPGSAAAVEQGCTCPVIDNRHGEGAWEFEGEMQWWMAEDCPLHGFILTEATEPSWRGSR